MLLVPFDRIQGQLQEEKKEEEKEEDKKEEESSPRQGGIDWLLGLLAVFLLPGN